MVAEIPRFESAHVLVVGDVMLDRYWHGNTERISPEAPVPVVHVNNAEERPGGAGNVAVNIAALQSQVSVMGLTGDDEACVSLETILQQANVNCLFTKLADSKTITKLRVMSRHQQLIRLDFEDGFIDHNPADIHKQFAGQLANANLNIGAVVLSDYGKGVLRDIQPLIQLARKHQLPVLIDPKGHNFERYRDATLITPNLSEFEAVVGKCDSDKDVVEKGTQLMENLNLSALLVTRSDKGMTLLQRNVAALHLPTVAKEVFDVTGAGDTVISVLAAALAAGVDLADATALSNIGAGVVVSKIGTATVNQQELVTALRETQPMRRGVVSETQMVEFAASARIQGEKVVMTNGCFDILHPGHVAYLEQARKLGDRLVIAVNDDDSVKRLKGESRPVNTLARRMSVLSALECVDWVVPFSEDTPERLICEVKPGILVKGGDYTPEQIAGGKCVKEHGGEVIVLEYVEGHSTSDIINNILNQ